MTSCRGTTANSAASIRRSAAGPRKCCPAAVPVELFSRAVGWTVQGHAVQGHTEGFSAGIVGEIGAGEEGAPV